MTTASTRSAAATSTFEVPASARDLFAALPIVIFARAIGEALKSSQAQPRSALQTARR